jgi:hypothetical protein
MTVLSLVLFSSCEENLSVGTGGIDFFDDLGYYEDFSDPERVELWRSLAAKNNGKAQSTNNIFVIAAPSNSFYIGQPLIINTKRDFQIDIRMLISFSSGSNLGDFQGILTSGGQNDVVFFGIENYHDPYDGTPFVSATPYTGPVYPLYIGNNESAWYVRDSDYKFNEFHTYTIRKTGNRLFFLIDDLKKHQIENYLDFSSQFIIGFRIAKSSGIALEFIKLDYIDSAEDINYLSVRTLRTEKIKSNSVDVTGEITNLGNETVTDHGFYYTDGGVHWDKVSLGPVTQKGEFKTTLTNLSENTRYYVRAYAANEMEEVTGSELEIQTLTAYDDVTVSGNIYFEDFSNPPTSIWEEKDDEEQEIWIRNDGILQITPHQNQEITIIKDFHVDKSKDFQIEVQMNSSPRNSDNAYHIFMVGAQNNTFYGFRKLIEDNFLYWFAGYYDGFSYHGYEYESYDYQQLYTVRKIEDKIRFFQDKKLLFETEYNENFAPNYGFKTSGNNTLLIDYITINYIE